MTQPEDDQGQPPPLELQPFSPPPGPPYGATPGQGFGTPPGRGHGTPPHPGYGTPVQTYGAYQAYPGFPTSTAGKPPRDPALAEWWQRLVARIIDGIILAILIGPFWVATVIAAFHRIQRVASQYPDLSQPDAQQALNQATNGMIGTFLLISVAAALISFGYDWLQHGLWGQTLGKRVMGTKVVTAEGWSRITGRAACGRAAVYALVPAVPYAGGLFGLINELSLLWDPRRQCLHDKAAHTVVVKTSMLGLQAAQPNSSG